MPAFHIEALIQVLAALLQSSSLLMLMAQVSGPQKPMLKSRRTALLPTSVPILLPPKEPRKELKDGPSTLDPAADSDVVSGSRLQLGQNLLIAAIYGVSQHIRSFSSSYFVCTHVHVHNATFQIGLFYLCIHALF